MATYYLDVDDEITSAAARVRTCPDSAVALVLPSTSHVATSRINFRLLAREAAKYQRRLTIVAPEAGVRSLARSAGLPVFATVGEYEAAEAARPTAGPNGEPDAVSGVLGELAATMDRAGSGTAGRGRGAVSGRAGSGAPRNGGHGMETTAPRRRRIGLSGAVAIGLASVILAAAAFGAYLFVPSNAITVTVREEPLGPLQLSIRVDPSVGTVNSNSLAIPGSFWQSKVEASSTFQATGKRVDSTKATGTVTFQNCDTGSAHLIPAGATLKTLGLAAFTTASDVSLAVAAILPGPSIACTHGKTAVTAVVAGTGGNVPAGKITVLPATYNRVVLSVTNDNPTTGGSATTHQIVSQSDVDNAKLALSGQLISSFAAELAAPSSLPVGLTLFEATGQLGAVVYDPDPATLVNSEVDPDSKSFQLAATTTGSALTADLVDARTVAERQVRASVDDGYTLDEGSVSIQVGAPVIVEGKMTLPVAASAMEAPSVNADDLRNAVKGKSADQARQYLSKYGNVEISSWPGLWTSDISGYDFRIEMKVVLPAQHPSATPTAGSTEGG